MEFVARGKLPTTFAFGCGFSGVGFGVEYGTLWPGVSRVMEMANVDCSDLPVAGSGTFAGGTGI